MQFLSEHTGNLTSISKNHYLQTVGKFIKATQEQYQKIIYSRIKPFQFDTGNLFELFMALKEQYQKTFVYLVNIPKIGCWMGASPEIFIQKQQNIVQTVALAGTQRNLGLPLNKVQWGRKEIEEQAIVSQYIEDILTQQQIIYHKTRAKTTKAGNVLHLKTKFRFSIKKGFFSLIKALHPTPAVCGIPKQKAKAFIAKTEAHKRAYYTGFLGPLNIYKSSDLFVNLRCMQVFKDKFALYIGGGITKDSVAIQEWEETEMKAQTLENVIEQVCSSPFFV